MKQPLKNLFLLLTAAIIIGCGGKKENNFEGDSESKPVSPQSPQANKQAPQAKLKEEADIASQENVQFCAPVIVASSNGCVSYNYSVADQAYIEPLTYTGDQFMEYDENPFLNAHEAELSTFAIDADGGSYSYMRRCINNGVQLPKGSVRIEEYINYFTFDYAEPGADENVSINSELSVCPWNVQHHLLRIGLKGKSIPATKEVNSNFVFLIDVSGSMSDPDKLDLLKSGFKLMVDGLKNGDRVAIVTYAGEAGVLLESTSGREKKKIKDAIDKLGAGGSTAGADGIITAYDIAKKNFIRGGNNRVILGTDGDFNVGVSSTEELIKLIEDKRETGIFLTTLGVGTGNLNEHMMEQLADKGNGNYEYIDNEKQIEKVFLNEKNKFYTVAKDCKIQVKFNSDIVESYRLVGYENRALNNEDFEDDKKDAGEIGASQTITAIYEVVLKSTSTRTPLANIDFRYKFPKSLKSRLLSQQIENKPVDIYQSSENMRFSAALCGFGLLIKNSKHKGKVTKKMILALGKSALSYDPNGYRSEFISIVNAANI